MDAACAANHRWHDCDQHASARNAARGKCRRRVRRCAYCGLFFTGCVAAVFFLSVVLTMSDDAAAAANSSVGGGRQRKTVREKMQMEVVTASSALGSLLLAGHALRRKSRWLRALHLPSSVIGGLVGWLFFAAVELFGAGELADDWLAEGWSVLPGFCTNVIFSSLFLGTPVPQPNVILAPPRREHFIYGLLVVFGQYVVSAACATLFRWFDPSLSAPFATVLPRWPLSTPLLTSSHLLSPLLTFSHLLSPPLAPLTSSHAAPR